MGLEAGKSLEIAGCTHHPLSTYNGTQQETGVPANWALNHPLNTLCNDLVGATGMFRPDL
jgi:hypothetical protein